MTRRFLDDVRGDIVTQLQTAANTTGPELSALLIDTIDSTVQDEANIASTVSTVGLVTTTAFVPMLVFGEDNGGDGVFLTPDFLNGTITVSPTAGFTYTFSCNVSIENLQNSVPCEFVVMENGSPVGLSFALTGDGNNDPVTIAIRHLVNAAPANAVYSIGVRTPSGANTLDVLAIEMIAVIHPTNNP